jgi:hypothetical protein
MSLLYKLDYSCDRYTNNDFKKICEYHSQSNIKDRKIGHVNDPLPYR